MKLFLNSLFICFTSFLLAQEAPSNTDYYEGEIIVKVNPQLSHKCSKSSIAIPSIQKIIAAEKIDQVEKMFPNHQKVTQKKGQENFVDLSTIYFFKFDASLDERKILNQLRKDPAVQYAELNYINELVYDPSDTLKSRQWYLAAVNLFQAWDIQKGDTSVVIAIVDTGSDLDHPDLVSDFAYNYNDPINGIDDDNDGYIDNFNGWDIVENNNSPDILNSGHGTNVAGIASASTDNVTGVSGAGFNTKILTVKIYDENTGGLPGAYQGIVYAADHGAFIINNSWGSSQYSAIAQDIVNYAAINRKCFVIAATGNNGQDIKFYPAAYDNVFSVGSMDNRDTIKANSNYGYWVDVYAPGESMYTCNAIGGYQYNGGTSMASPLVAGIAGLVKSQFPNYTAEQVAEHLRNSGDDIYALNDPKYTDKLGSGRINAFKAVSNSSKPGIKFINKTVSDNNDNIFALGDTLRISGAFRNFLTNAQNVSATISTIGNKLQILNPTISLGNINQLDSVSIRSNPFELIIPSGVDFNENIDVLITITADNYLKKQYFDITTNVNYITISENNLTLSITSDGGIGFGGDASDLGAGIKHLNGDSHLFEGGLIIGNSSAFISNKFRGQSLSPDLDFKTNSTVKEINAKVADFECTSTFTDGNISPAQLSIVNKNYVFKHHQALNSVIYEYEITNTSASKIDNLYVGMLLDWDIANYANNKINYDASRRMGISFSTDTSIFCGVRVLTDSIGSTHYGIDNVGDPTINGGLNSSDGFSDAEKFQVISSQRNSAGGNVTSSGNDIIDVNSIGPFNLEPNGSRVVAFSITVSDSLANLNQETDTVKNLYERIVLSTPTLSDNSLANRLTISPNPAKEFLKLNLSLAKTTALELRVFSTSGKLVYYRGQESFARGEQYINFSISNWKTGVYFIELKGDGLIFQDKFVVAN